MLDPLRAQRKLTQVGYYRLSGYWSPALKYKSQDGKYEKINKFKDNTTFDSVFSFYLFDKKLRQELSCALERIEIYLRTIIAHEIGRLGPLAHNDKKNFSKKALTPNLKNQTPLSIWIKKHDTLLEGSREDSISSHLKTNKPIPIWVASEAWTFGTISKFYSMLNGKNQKLICDRLGIDNRTVLENWLINLAGTRNRCAHHSRTCNRPNPRVLKIPNLDYFNQLQLESFELEKLYGLITVIWFLVKKIGPSSNWINRIADLIDNMPNVNGLTLKSMGFKTDSFPRHLFPTNHQSSIRAPATSDLLEETIKNATRLVDNIESIAKQASSETITSEQIERIFNLAIRLEQIKEKQTIHS